MKRGDAAVFGISAALGVIVVAAVAVSLLVIDRRPDPSANEPANSTSSLLVLTWAPSLCQVEPSNRGCRNGHVGRMGPAMLLHGLWPQPKSEQFCGVSTTVAEQARDPESADLPPLNLPADVETSLQAKLSDGAIMTPHEWYRHGTCSGVPPDVYFGHAVTLTEQAGNVLDPIFEKAAEEAGNGRLSVGDVRDRFEAEFGKGAGERVSLTCREVDGQGIVIYEVHLSLPPVSDLGAVMEPLSLSDLLVRGPTVSAGCRHGRVPG